jgi:hypothetical protein
MAKRRSYNPRRPPKSWWDHCVRAVSRSSARDPRAVCGATWRDMSPEKKRAALRREKNPLGLFSFFR